VTLWRVRATVDDRPGFLAVLTASLALRAINILAVQVHTTEAGAVDDFLVDAPDQLTEAELIAAVERGRGRDPWVCRADAHGLVDLPTQALSLANRLVQDPESLGGVLAALVGGEVSWRPAPGGGVGLAGNTMRLPDPAGGCYLVTRDAPGFTPAEYARAQALVDLAATAGRQAAVQASLLLADGTELAVRLAGPEDLDTVRAMHERCSPTSRHRRYLGRAEGPSADRLGRLLAPARGLALAASAGADQIVAVANLAGEGVLAAAAVLVEDGWQGRGIGTALLRRLVTVAADSGYAALELYTLAENAAMLRTLCRLGHAYTADRDGPVVSITLPLRPAPQRAPLTEDIPGFTSR
jgi:GNAT superfamily N-acetyltransferase